MTLFYFPANTKIRLSDISRDQTLGDLSHPSEVPVSISLVIDGAYHNCHPSLLTKTIVVTFSSNTSQWFKREMKKEVRRTGLYYSKMTTACYVLSQIITLEIVHYAWFFFFFSLVFQVFIGPHILSSLTPKNSEVRLKKWQSMPNKPKPL